MGKQFNPLLDPRGYQERTMITLAKRPTLDELRNGKILFYNNTKLGFCKMCIRDRMSGMGNEGLTTLEEMTKIKNIVLKGFLG